MTLMFTYGGYLFTVSKDFDSDMTMILLYLLSGSWWGQVTREEGSMTCDTEGVDQVQN